MITLPYGAVDTPASIEIDGQTYAILAVNSSGQLVVALDLSALSAATSIANGQHLVTTAGSAEQMTSQACKAATVRALPSNTGNVYVGTSSVDSSNGHVLDAGAAVNLAINNLNLLYLDVDTNGEGVSWMTVN